MQPAAGASCCISTQHSCSLVQEAGPSHNRTNIVQESGPNQLNLVRLHAQTALCFVDQLEHATAFHVHGRA